MTFTTYSKDEIDALISGVQGAGRTRFTSNVVITAGIGGDYSTGQAAVDYLYGMDFNNFAVSLNLLDGTHEPIVLTGPFVGQRSISDFTIQANGQAANCLIDGGNSPAIDVSEHARATVDNCSIQAPGSVALRSWYGGTINIGGGTRLGTCGVCQIYSSNLSRANANRGYSVYGDAERHLLLEGGDFSFVGGTLNFEGQRTFSNAFMEGGYSGVLDWQPAGITGDMPICKKYNLHIPSWIVPTAGNMAMLDNLPGTLPGIISDNITITNVYNASSQQVPSGNWTAIAHDTTLANAAGWFDPTTYRFNPKQQGYYLIIASAEAASFPSGNQLLSRLFKNGATASAYGDATPSITANVMVKSSDLMHFNGSTDYVEHQVYQNIGSQVGFFEGPAVSYFKAIYLGDWNI